MTSSLLPIVRNATWGFAASEIDSDQYSVTAYWRPRVVRPPKCQLVPEVARLAIDNPTRSLWRSHSPPSPSPCTESTMGFPELGPLGKKQAPYLCRVEHTRLPQQPLLPPARSRDIYTYPQRLCTRLSCNLPLLHQSLLGNMAAPIPISRVPIDVSAHETFDTIPTTRQSQAETDRLDLALRTADSSRAWFSDIADRLFLAHGGSYDDGRSPSLRHDGTRVKTTKEQLGCPPWG